MTPQEAIEAAELAEAETRYRLQFAREIHAVTAAAEFSRGFEEGYMCAVADVKAAQQGIVRDARLEEVRWGPGGREHFADPRPGDFPGRVPAHRQPEPEPELEAEIT
ncbi:MAG TPA: hypothetical protein VFQ68_19130 [Streptosporangiaceae bacterium]|nr:hypothetical protein [Streptosporangiaceae bacterium]